MVRRSASPAPDEKVYIRDIQRLTGVRMTPMPLPEGFNEAAANLPGPARMEKGPAPRGRSGRREARRDDRRDSRRDGRRSGNRHGRPARAIGDDRADQGQKRSSYDPTAYREKEDFAPKDKPKRPSKPKPRNKEPDGKKPSQHRNAKHNTPKGDNRGGNKPMRRRSGGRGSGQNRAG